MELKDFVSRTLLEVCEGVRSAQALIHQSGNDALINPHVTRAGTRHSEDIEFDVAVTASEGTEKNAEVGVKVIPFLSAGVGGKSNASIGTVSRIRFKVPVAYPKIDY